nr:ester hydrolase C11orf54 [Hymenolepis microstoma]
MAPVFEGEVIDHDSERQPASRSELTNEFGSVWSKKSLRERDQVEARTLAANDANVLQKVAVGVSKVKNEAQENSDEKEANGVAKTQQEQLLPQFDQQTKIVSQIFPLSSLIPPSVANALAQEANAISTADDKARKDLIKRNRYPSFLAERLHYLPTDNLESVSMSQPAAKRRRKDASGELGERMTRIQMATILAYLGHMFSLFQLRMNELQQKMPLPNTPALVAKSLLTKFTTLTVQMGKVRSKTRLITPMLRDKLLYHILILILHCDNFSTVIDKLPVDFKMSSVALKKYFTFIGCTFSVQEVKRPEGEDQTTEKKTETIAHLRAPLVFKPARLSGQNVVCDVGSMKYLLPVIDKSKRYSFDEVAELSKIIHGQLLGAGAGPFFIHNKSCEMAANVEFSDSKIISNSTLHGVYNETTYEPEVIRATDNNFALLAHLLSTEGLPGSVIEVDVSGRLKEGSAYVFLREALTSAFGKLAKPVALGGVFALNDSKARFHVLCGLPDHPVDTPEKVAAFVKHFEMEPPVLGVGTLVSHDPYNVDLKLEHFHCYNEAQTLAGHFYWDTEPEKAHYRFYLAVAKNLLRIDPRINQ